MSKSRVAATIVAVATLVGALWFMRGSAIGSRAGAPPVGAREQGSAGAPPVNASRAVSRGSAASRPVATDPRLAALISAPDGTLVDYLLDADGRLIKEVDSDPNSLGYRRTLREYTYSADKLIRLVKYHYSAGEARIIKVDVVYRPDGSIDQYHEMTSFEYGK